MSTIKEFFSATTRESGKTRKHLRGLIVMPLALLTACATQQPEPDVKPAEPIAAVQAPPAEAPAPEPARAAPEAAPASSDQVAALQTWIDQQNRLYTIAAPILINNTALCKRNARNLLGLTAKNRYSYSNAYAAAATAALGLSERLRVMNVLPGSGADEAGMKKGDVLLSVENKPIAQGPNAERDGAALVSAAMQGRSAISLTFLRDGKRQTLSVPLTRACAFGIELGNSDDITSYADGHRVLITRGMLNYAGSDEELAYVLAKEIAHNVLAPAARGDMGAAIDRLRAFKASPDNTFNASGIKPYSPVLDATADKLALYLLVRANYGIDNNIRFWEKLATQYPAGIRNSHTYLHPQTPYRVSVMNQIVRTIKEKQGKNLPLVP